MPNLVECPRCKQSLSVADKMAGTSVICPYCNGRLLVPQNLSARTGPAPEMAVPPLRGASPPAAPAPAAGEAAKSPGAEAPPVVCASPLPGAVVPVPQSVQVPRPQPPTPAPRPTNVPLSPPASAPPRKVARFITAEAARSPLTLSADGKLPDLHLTESNQRGAKQEKPVRRNPLVLLGAVCLSVVASAMLAFMDVSPPPSQHNKAKQAARRVLEEDFFSDLGTASRPQYQLDLRDAQRAFARGDHATERKLYSKVLDQLRAERGPFDTITGTRARDKRLEEQLTNLLRED
ncbi:MAG: hypothetical protein ABFD16_03270 [Thermoguttaceae bacterium]